MFITLLAAGAAACADSTAPRAGVTEAMLTSDVANNVAEVTTQDLDQIGGLEGLVGLPGASIPPNAPFQNCAWQASNSVFVCPTITTPGGLTLQRFFEILVGGSLQRSYDALATESIVESATLEGTVAQPDRTTWVTHHLLMEVSGLAGTETERSWRGEGSRDDSAHVNADGVARTVRFRSHDEIDRVVYKLPRSEFPFPQSGTITYQVSVSATVPDGTEQTNRRGDRHVVVTFNGTRTASVLVENKPCTLDLVTRRISCS